MLQDFVSNVGQTVSREDAYTYVRKSTYNLLYTSIESVRRYVFSFNESYSRIDEYERT